MIFQMIPLRFEFEAGDAFWFPPGKAGNTFRGALGRMLPEALFLPNGDGTGPSGFEDRPRSFILRTAELDGRRFEPGERFALDVNLFDPEAPLLDHFIAAFERLSREGLGPHRGRFQFIQAKQADPLAMSISNCDSEEAVALELGFLTPMELKFQGAILREPRFDVLFALIRDRISSLCLLYQGGAPHVDYRGLGDRARAVITTSLRIEQTEIERRSSRTGQRHGIGGFIGKAEYSGDLGEFLPWLRAAEWTGVGRHTVWGNGALRVRTLAGISGDNVAVEPDTGRGHDAVVWDSET